MIIMQYVTDIHKPLFSPFPILFFKGQPFCQGHQPFQCWNEVNPLPRMPILGSSNSAANKDMMTKIWTNGVQLSD